MEPRVKPDRHKAYEALEQAMCDVAESHGFLDKDSVVTDWVMTVALVPMATGGRTQYINLMSQEGHLPAHIATGLASIGSDMIAESTGEYE
jgi:hypothetical protein